MEFNKKLLIDFPVYQLEGKRVFVRADLNDPADSEGNLTGDMRIRAVLPTIGYLVNARAKVILASHFGRPKNREKEFSLRGVKKRLEELSSFRIHLAPDCQGEDVVKLSKELKNGEVLLLENLRFCPGETKNDPEYARFLASLGDIYVAEAFGACHREHASISSVPKLIPSMAGFLLAKEINTLNKLLHNPEQPLVVVAGGKKVSDKIKVIGNLIDKVDSICVGGGMSFAFLKAKGYEIGRSYVEDNMDAVAKEILGNNGKKILLPVDVMVAKELRPASESKVVNVDEIPPDWYGVDIGPKTIEMFKAQISKAKTIFWNGPLGIVEIPDFSYGTRIVGLYIALSSAITVSGGGDTAEVVRMMNLDQHFTHVSTGGGAALKFLEGADLPGISVLPERS
ncbi:Phosphoglycerate kinase [Thermodesulfobium narugense DSM 14796]|uniref:Phosphoglycerate kinase n=1 Tax=Thermodesulfobium narugense DSM 14796 TaxID=747365 RepID=M1E8M0_9BACT|nr:phosphoglycerate kinase [Thermodesulfobium narugense]AEE15238.1 Phosphoglycerate kinase [Thermodesulfobium narugense DSM 14796]